MPGFGSDVDCEASAFFRREARHATDPGTLFPRAGSVVWAYDPPQSPRLRVQMTTRYWGNA